MKLSLWNPLLCVVAFATPLQAITLLQVLQSYSELSSLSSYVNASSNATALLANANNFTFLAPSNTAIAAFISHNPNILTEDLLGATLQYSLLKGGYPTLSFSDAPQFVATNLVNSTYANITGGQTVELGLDSNGAAQVLTGNKTISTSASADIVCTGGIIHIIDTVPSIPTTAVAEITAANLKYFVSILSEGNYLNTANTYVNAILEVPDVTYFIPNSATALSNVSALVKNSSAADLQSIFEYHVVPGFVGHSTELTDGMVLKTAEGDNLTVTVRDGKMFVNAAKVIASDYMVANGVVHVIDNLLNRFDTSPPTQATSTSATPTPTSLPTSTLSSTTTSIQTHLSNTKSHTSSTSPTTIGIAVGVTLAGIFILITILILLLLRRRKHRQEQQIQSSSTSSPSNFNPLNRNSHTPSTSTTSEKAQNIYVEHSIDVRRQDSGSSATPLRVQTMGVRTMGARTMVMDQFQSLHVDDIGGPMYEELEKPYIPPRSPSRLVGRGENSFF